MAMLKLNGDPEKNKKAASGNKLTMKQTVTPKVDNTKIVLPISALGVRSKGVKDNDEPFDHFQEVSSGGVSKYYTAKAPGGDNSIKSKNYDIRSIKNVSEIDKEKFDKGKQTGGRMPKFDRDSGTYIWD